MATKKYFKLLMIISFVFISGTTNSFSQNSNTTNLSTWVNRIAQFNSTYPQENVYMQLDNTSYFAGETIFFKAWITMSGNNKFSKISKVLYVDLISPSGSIIDSRKIRVESSGCHGSMTLPDSISAADYRIRAYTRWQQNFSVENMFTQVIPIYNFEKKIGFNFSQKLCKGADIDTLKMRIALIDSYKQPLISTELKLKLSTSGFDWKKNVITTDKDGMADVQFLLPTAEKNRTAYITAEFKDGWRTQIQDKTISLMPENITVQFLPEGGNMIEGIQNHIAFKVVDENGKPTDAKGMIYENNKTEIIAFESKHSGMGSFYLTPKAGCTYKAVVWTKSHSDPWMFLLPDCISKGYAMECTRSQKDVIKIKLTGNIGMAGEKLGFLVQHCGNNQIFNELTFEGDSLFLYLPVKKLPTGINQITIFNTSGEPVAERLVFVRNPEKNIKLDVLTKTDKFKPRQSIEVRLNSNDPEGKPVSGEFALAVRDVSSEPNRSPYDNNLITSLFLTSDIKGPVRNPGYYFQDGNEDVLDLLLLTQGWRRYVWKNQTFKEPFNLNYKAEKGIVISGSVLSLIRKKPLPDCEISMLLHLDSILYVDVAHTDSNGVFTFVSNFEGKHDLQLQTRKKPTKKAETRILLERKPAPANHVLISTGLPWPEEKVKIADKNIDSTKNNGLDIKTIKTLEGLGRILPEVVITAKSFYETINSRATYTYDAEKIRDDIRDKGEDSFDNDIHDGIYQMLFSKDPVNWTIIDISDEAGNVITMFRYKGKEIIMVNASWSQSQVNEYNDVNTGQPFRLTGGYTINDVERILVVDDKQVIKNYCDMQGTQYFNIGAVVFYYLYPDDKRRREPIGIRNTSFEGYSIVKEFYCPDYSVNLDIPEPDRRRTLYWNPSVKTDSAGTATVRFYNNDSATQLEFTAEGFSEKEMSGSLTKQTTNQ